MMHLWNRIGLLFAAVTLIPACGSGGEGGVAGTTTYELFGVDTTTNQLIAIDDLTGAGIAVGPTGAALPIVGLAIHPVTKTLFATDGSQLLTIDRTTGAAALVAGITGIATPDVQSLAFDLNGTALYGFDNFSQKLVTINPVTGAATAIGAAQAFTVFGLAPRDAVSLYAINSAGTLLYTVAVATGVFSTGPATTVAVDGLAWDAASSTLFGTNTTADTLVSINPVTGAVTTVGPLGFGSVKSLGP